MKAIVAVDEKWGIGCSGKLLFKIPEDMKHFRRVTLGSIIVMGHTTFESLPGRQPLKDRVNVVLSRDDNFFAEGVHICHSVDELLRFISKYDGMDCSNRDCSNRDCFIIGGESVYQQLMPYCSEVLVTRVEGSFPADRFFPDIARDTSFRLEEESGRHEYNGLGYRFCSYVKA